ncbi:MAG: hypothetical protein KGM16_06155 [Bacteroidota bacterium]|nr:hypothetical protein [Bacteroidota bacterium]
MKQLIYGCISLLGFLNAGAQNIDSTLATYAKDYGQEKMYLQYDKSSYAPGETVWFKDYLMKGMFPDDESKTVYIDWIGENGNILLHSVCAVENASTFGQFEIPVNYTGQFIHVKAYTKWMLNFDTSFLYNHDLKILSEEKKSSAKSELIPELHFFPEGGDAIAGITNKIAFKVNDQYGRPVSIKGVVKDNTGSVIDSLKIIHNGMGYFFIFPHEGQTFSALWEYENGDMHTTPLPAIKNSGVGLRVTVAGSKRIFLVSSSPSSSLTRVHILGTMYENKIFALDETLEKGKVEGTIPTESLPSGILTITVFDQQWKPLAERITYVNNEDYLFQPEVNFVDVGFKKRAKNDLEISVPDNMSANLSVSVTDAKLESDNSDNIISHLLLTAELKGKVYDPAHYFLNKSDSIAQQLDLVMLTHGWRRFNWEKVIQGKFPVIKYPKDTSYLSLSGKVIGATPEQLQKAGDIILMLTEKNSGTQTFTIPVAPNGYFDDPSLILFDTAQIFYDFATKKSMSKISVQFMPDILPPFSNYFSAPVFSNLYFKDTTGNNYHLQLSREAELQLQYFKGKVLENINIKSKIKSKVQMVNDKYTSGLFKAGNATELDLLDDPLSTSYTDIVSYIQGKVPSLYFDNTANKFLWMRNRAGENGPGLYLNEMATSYDMISNIPVANVAYIKVFRPGVVGAPGSGTGGAIVIYTKIGKDGEPISNLKGLDNNHVNGYTVVREFYSPDYDTLATDDKKDLRTTLYWNPTITTSPGQNKVNLTFFNNDFTGEYRVIIEGMTNDGRLTHIEKIVK